jgi:hypothetical protein
MNYLLQRECDRLIERGSTENVSIRRVSQFRHEREYARWLVASAIETLVREGLPPALLEDVEEGESHSNKETSELDDRSLAGEVVKTIMDGGVFGPLLALSATSQFVVVGVAGDKEEQSLEVDTPRLQIDSGLVADSRH